MKKRLWLNSRSSLGLYTALTAILVFIICTKQPVDADMWWHLRSGQVMWQQKVILIQDQFSFTKFHQPWVNAFWLSDLLLYSFVWLGGFSLIIAIVAAVGAFTFHIIFLNSFGPYLIRSFVIIIGAISVSPFWTARPQVFSFLLLALLNYWMEKRNQLQGPPLFLLPILFIVWVNIHGGFIWGFLLLAAEIVSKGFEVLLYKNEDRLAMRRNFINLTFWTVISLLAVSINPNGLSIWKLPFYTIDVSIAVIQEWFSPNFHLLEMQPFLWMIFLLIFSLSFSKKKQSFACIFKSIGFIYMAFVAQRNIPIAVIVITPIIIENLSGIWSNIDVNKKDIKNLSNSAQSQLFRRSGIINISLIILISIGAIGQVYLQSSWMNIKRIYPSDAIVWIQENKPEGNMYNSYNWGGYLVYNLPTYPVFIDGRADLFGEKLIKEWWDIAEGKDNADALLDTYNINFLLIEPDWPIVNNLVNKNWTITYQDEISVILIREN